MLRSVPRESGRRRHTICHVAASAAPVSRGVDPGVLQQPFARASDANYLASVQEHVLSLIVSKPPPRPNGTNNPRSPINS